VLGYLDMVCRAANAVDVPVAAYQLRDVPGTQRLEGAVFALNYHHIR
jgi:hypothetical protein